MTPEQLQAYEMELRSYSEKCPGTIVDQALQVIDAERKSHEETRRERDVLARLIEGYSDCIERERIYQDGTTWRRCGIATEYKTALEAIRSALAQQKQQETNDA